MNLVDSTLVDGAEIDRYLDAVRNAFADLPAADLDELLEDVADHLAEVAAESGEPLADRLGPPAAYAEELRAAAGTPAASAGARAAARLRMRRSAADRRLGRILGYDRFSDFLGHLAPAWWVIRGYAAAMLVTWLVDRPDGPLPRIAGSVVLGFLLALPLIAVSVWLGRHTRGPRGRYPAWLANAALALVMVAGLTQVDLRLRGGPAAPDEPGVSVELAAVELARDFAVTGAPVNVYPWGCVPLVVEDRGDAVLLTCLPETDLATVVLVRRWRYSFLLIGPDTRWLPVVPLEPASTRPS